jgi:FkbM family methyltransferase
MLQYIANLISPTKNLQERITRLEGELSEIRTSQSRGPIDLVRLDDISLFMPTRDNLYRLVIPESCKKFPLYEHHRLAAIPAIPTEFDVTRLMLMYLDILFAEGIAAHFLDVGAWVGDVAIRLGRFARDRGGQFHAECFDPSYAGEFIPFNIELNGVSELVDFHPIGISLAGGPQVFSQFRGHSDSSRLQSIGDDGRIADYFVVRTRTLRECLPDLRTGTHLIVKIDVEGIDAQLVRQNRDALTNATLAVEFAPSQEQYRDLGPADFIRSLQTTHTLFDIFYLPRPTMARCVNDADEFVREISARRYGYTDVLAVPLSLVAHDKLITRLSDLAAIAPEYRMA